MPVASCSVFIFLKNIAQFCPSLTKLSPHDNCSLYDRLREELAVEADSAPRQWETEPECAASSADLQQHSCFGQITLFLFWLNFVTNKNRSERRYDC